WTLRIYTITGLRLMVLVYTTDFSKIPYKNKVFSQFRDKLTLDVKYMYDNTEAVGYFGGSTFERIPIEEALINTTKRFKKILEGEDEFTLKMLDGVKKHYKYVEFVKEYINKQYKEEILLDELASVIHISRTYLSFLFKKEVGITFPQYLTKFRINKAKELMKHSEFRINEISAMVGYSDPAYFNKIFKKVVGTTPYNYVIRIKKSLI
ncbi:MAG: helix-turn-helix domain-containing protein, partial [Candidatus Humimicrobiaceae bacterium]